HQAHQPQHHSKHQGDNLPPNNNSTWGVGPDVIFVDDTTKQGYYADQGQDGFTDQTEEIFVDQNQDGFADDTANHGYHSDQGQNGRTDRSEGIDACDAENEAGSRYQGKDAARDRNRNICAVE